MPRYVIYIMLHNFEYGGKNQAKNNAEIKEKIITIENLSYWQLASYNIPK